MVALDIASKASQQDLTCKSAAPQTQPNPRLTLKTVATGRAFVWTQVESCASIICACLPTLKAPISRFLPRLFMNSSIGGLGSRNRHQGSIPLSDVNGKCEARAWKDSGRRSTDDDYLTGDSQEQIVGIKKTISVRVISTESNEKMVTNQFDRMH